MFEPTLNLFSRYVSTVGPKRQYHSSRVCVDVAGRDSCRSNTIDILIYKITKIVRALWLAERSLCMRVCKHGYGIKMFCFSRANQASTSLKKFSSSKLDKFTLYTHSFVGWNLESRYKEGVSIFIRLGLHFKREKSVFWKASFCKTRTDYACKTSWTRLCDW